LSSVRKELESANYCKQLNEQKSDQFLCQISGHLTPVIVHGADIKTFLGGASNAVKNSGCLMPSYISLPKICLNRLEFRKKRVRNLPTIVVSCSFNGATVKRWVVDNALECYQSRHTSRSSSYANFLTRKCRKKDQNARYDSR